MKKHMSPLFFELMIDEERREIEIVIMLQKGEKICHMSCLAKQIILFGESIQDDERRIDKKINTKNDKMN